MINIDSIPYEIPIPGACCYYINKDGEVFSTKHKEKRKLKTSINPVCGYEYVALRINLKTVQTTIHRLMVKSFYGDLREGETVNHIDCNKTNNKIENLEILSQYENMQHAKRNRRFRSGENSPFSKITEKDVLDILEHHKNGLTGVHISRLYKISESMVSKIILGKKWKYIANP
jgi:hypothetical protein